MFADSGPRSSRAVDLKHLLLVELCARGLLDRCGEGVGRCPSAHGKAHVAPIVAATPMRGISAGRPIISIRLQFAPADVAAVETVGEIDRSTPR